MCEIYALSAARQMKSDDCLRKFFSDSKWNPHGWGISWHEGSELRLFKEPLTAVESAYLEYLLAMGISSTLLIAHIRNATRGSMSYSNCHPFVGTDASGVRWLLVHNGTILNDALIKPYEAVQGGTTDSERVLLLLLDRMNEAIRLKGGALSIDERYDVLARLMGSLSEGNKLNLAIEDGERIYAHTNTIQPTLYVNRQPGAVHLCSRPLEAKRGWEALNRCALFVLEGGRIVRLDTVHDKLFDNDSYLKMIAAMLEDQG